MAYPLNDLNTDLAAVVKAAQPGLVQVHNGGRGTGAGVIIHSEGLIVTNAHVASRGALKVALMDGRTFRGRILAIDNKMDLAAVSVEASGLPVIEMADGRGIRPGMWVVALGHPWGVTGAVTAGIIIDAGRPVQSIPYDGQLIQAGLRLRPGHSGGPLLNEEGLLVGINMMITGPNVGLAIPVQAVRHFLKQTLGESRPSVS